MWTDFWFRAKALFSRDRLERDLEDVVQRRLGDVEDQQRAHRDAELARGEHERRVLHGPQRRLGGA